MIAWDEVNTALGYFLDDTGASLSHSVPLRILAWNAAQDTFVNHTARERQVELTLKEDGRSVVLPDDYFEAAMLYDSTNQKFYYPAKYQYGGYRDPEGDEYSVWTWGGNLYLGRQATEAETTQLYYFAYWPKVTYTIADAVVTITEGDILVPRWAQPALLHLTAAYVLQPMAVSSARNREYNIMIDSGRPTDNARSAQAREHLFWYNELLGLHAPQSRLGGITR